MVFISFKKLSEVAGPLEVELPLWKKLLVPAIAGAIIGALILFGLLRFLRKRPAPVPETVPVTEEVPTIAGAEVLRERAKELEIVKTVTEVAGRSLRRSPP